MESFLAYRDFPCFAAYNLRLKFYTPQEYFLASAQGAKRSKQVKKFEKTKL